MSNVTYMEPDDGSLRFYRVEVKGTKTIVTFGKLGNEGATREYDHATAAEAAEHAESLVNKQEYKGFKKTTKRKRDTDESPKKKVRVAKEKATEKISGSKETPTPAAKTGTKKPATKKEVVAKVGAKKVAREKKPAAKKETTPTPEKETAPEKEVTPKKETTPRKVTKKATPTKKSATKNATENATPEKETTSPKKAKTKKENTRAKKATTEKDTPKNATWPAEVPVTPAIAIQPRPTYADLPIEWEVRLPMDGYGIYVNDTHVYAGDETGLVQQFDKLGFLQKQYRLPTGVKCIVGDGIFLYVGTNDGCLYDITSGVPRLMCKINLFASIFCMDVRNGLVAASDALGSVALINVEGETIWIRKEDGRNGWMCLIDSSGVYHGASNGVHKRELTAGVRVWTLPYPARILFGQQDNDYVYTTNADCTCKIDKKTGRTETTIFNGGTSIGVSKGSNKLIAVSNGAARVSLYNADGTLYEQFPNPPGHPGVVSLSMAAYGEHEFYGISQYLTKYNFSPESLEKAKSGQWMSQIFTAQNFPEVMPETSVETTTDTSKGVLCECVKEGGKLRIRVISPGYDSSWNTQFPRAIREEGVKYVVEKIVEQEGFYRVWGDIKKVQS